MQLIDLTRIGVVIYVEIDLVLALRHDRSHHRIASHIDGRASHIDQSIYANNDTARSTPSRSCTVRSVTGMVAPELEVLNANN